MNELYEKLDLLEGTFDIILDPEVGPMELQEIGLSNRLEYNQRDQFAYAQELDIPSLWQIIRDTADNLGISEEEPEIVDKLTEKIYKSFIEHKEIKGGKGFWVTFWYDAQVGHLHRQAKIEMFIKPHSQRPPEKFDFLDTRKNFWMQTIAEELKMHYQYGVELEQLNDYIKERGLLWLVEEMIDLGYDLYDILEDINRRIEE